MIECSLVDHIPKIGHTMVPLIWVLGQPPLRWEWWAIIPSSPVVTIVFYHAMEVSCYHSFWAVKLQLCLRLLLWGLLLVSTLRYSVKVRMMSNLSALTCKSASQSCLRIHLDCLTAPLQAIYLVLKTASRDAEEVIKVSSYIFWDSISSDNVIVWKTCCFHW